MNATGVGSVPVGEAGILWLMAAVAWCLAAAAYWWMTSGRAAGMWRYKILLVVPLAILVVYALRWFALLLSQD